MANSRGNIKHGGHGTLTYARWKSMMQRCYTQSASNYRYYGGIGISVCERWHDYASFVADMGQCQNKSLTLDRIDGAKNYEPGNCRWATKTEQNRNRSHCVELEYQGRKMILRDWAVEIGISPNALAQRLYLGWSVERALTTPLKRRTPK
jgi:hypothetical protein